MSPLKRLAIIGVSITAVGAFMFASPASANSFPTWGSSWCISPSAGTWAADAGINNDNFGELTITDVTVSNGVSGTGLSSGSVIAPFANGKITFSNVPSNLTSFTVTISGVEGPNNVSPTVRLNKPADCGTPATTAASTTTSTTLVKDTTTSAAPTTTAKPTTTAAPTSSSSSSTTSTTAASTSSTTDDVAGVTVTNPPAAARTVATTVAAKPVVLGDAVSPNAVSPVSALPATGSNSAKPISVVALLFVLVGLTLVSISRLSRPASR